MMFRGDFRLLAVKDLTAIVAAEFNNLHDFDNTGTMILSETFGFKVNDELSLGLNAVQFISNADSAKDINMLFHVWGTYAIGNVVPRLDVAYFMGANSHASRYDRRGFGNPSYNNDNSVISLRPSVRINLDNRTHMEIGNVTYINDGASEVMRNITYLDFRWSF